MTNRMVPLCRVVAGAITAYTVDSMQAPSVDAQGNLLVTLSDGAGGEVGQLSSGATQIPFVVTAPLTWQVNANPAVNTVAIATKAAGGAGVRHVLTAVCFSVNVFTALAAPLTFLVRDGASGVGNNVFTVRVSDGQQIFISGINFMGTANTAMCAEFTAAPGATNFENVQMYGYSVVLA